MAAAKFSKTITSGVCEEFHECEWIIKNWDLVQVDESLVKDQQFELETGHKNSLSCKFLVGLEVTGATVGVFCKLIELSGNIAPNNVLKADVPVGFGVVVKNPNGEEYWAPAAICKSMKVEELIQHPSGFDFNVSPNPKSDQYLVDGSLSIHVNLRVLNPVTVPQKITSAMALFESKSATSLTSHFASLLGDQKMSDVTIVTKDKQRFKCHKVVLSARNEAFAALLKSNFSEKNSGTIEVADISGKTMKVLLHYIYTGKLLDSWCHPDVIVEFTNAAGKYLLTDVLEMLDSLLGHETDAPSITSFMLLGLAQELDLKDAQAKLMERIVKFTMAASSSSDLLKLVDNPANLSSPLEPVAPKQLPEAETTQLIVEENEVNQDSVQVEAAA